VNHRGFQESRAHSKFKNANGNEEHPFRRVEGIYPTVDKLECAGGKQIGAPIPPYVLYRVEFVCNDGNRCPNDGSILVT
jgi:hypothetical protein